MKQIFFILLLASCQSSMLDGTYCAEVDRYNPKTGKESAYTLLAGDMIFNVSVSRRW